MAYSLFGIFGVNLPLLYGEGEKAFFRLQEEILKQSTDHSIFAWRNDEDEAPANATDSAVNFLAKSPKAFKHTGNIVPYPESSSGPVELTKKGLRINLPIWKQASH
jgi:hypothetical protein